MKKKIILLITVALLVVLTGCSSVQNGNNGIYDRYDSRSEAYIIM
nr:hypothetical protein [uncultured Cetobacterium sp.]